MGISLFTALAGKGQMRATEEELALLVPYGYLSVQWRREAEREFLSVLPVLCSIAVASESESGVLDLLAFRIAEAVRAAIHIDLMDRPEYQVLGIYAIPQIAGQNSFRAETLLNPLDGFFALREMERRYTLKSPSDEARHVSLEYWNEMNPAGDLVDWTLLIAEVAALRSKILRFPPDFEVSPEIRFCHDLASALA